MHGGIMSGDARENQKERGQIQHPATTMRQQNDEDEGKHL